MNNVSVTCFKDLRHCTNTVFRDHEFTFVSLLVPLPAPSHTRPHPSAPARTRQHPPAPAAYFWLPALQQLGCCREQGECVGCGGGCRRGVCVSAGVCVGRSVCGCVGVLACRGVVVVW
jgi:hypothetical protein